LEIQFLDTHCHLEEPEFDRDLGVVIERAIKAGILMIVSPIRPETWNKGLQIAHGSPCVYASIGLDPMYHQEVEHVIQFIKNHEKEILSIGEVGLDHYRERNHNQRDLQEKAFRQIIQLAEEIKAPLQVHSRSAGRKCLEVLQSEEVTDVQMHAFDGKASLARSASRNLGYYFSIPTSVVRSPQKKKLVKTIDIERILLETDSPVLGPEKGVRNEPVNIQIALRESAQILNLEQDELREIILENTLRLYSRIRPQ
jgi:TatD DNase family protein